jgi:hypothetical protein
VDAGAGGQAAAAAAGRFRVSSLSEVSFGEVNDATGQPDVDDEAVVPDYVHWRDFGCTAGARVWDEVTAVWRRTFLCRDELNERFGEKLGKTVPLDRKQERDGGEDEQPKPRSPRPRSTRFGTKRTGRLRGSTRAWTSRSTTSRIRNGCCPTSPARRRCSAR